MNEYKKSNRYFKLVNLKECQRRSKFSGLRQFLPLFYLRILSIRRPFNLINQKESQIRMNINISKDLRRL